MVSWNTKQKIIGFLYILPLFIVVLLLFLYPLIYSVYISFTNMAAIHFLHFKYIGLFNYEMMIKDKYLATLLINTVIWTLGSLIPMIALGLSLAIILNQKDLYGKSIFYAILILPWAFPGFISLLVWQGMWVDPYGFMNRYVLPFLHLPHVNSLISVSSAWTELIVTNLWLSFPYYMTVFYSGLQSIPQELYEIADVDGAGPLQKFATITFPSLRKIIAFVFITSFVFTWNNFYPIYILTGGGPGIATETFTVYAYQQAFSQYNYAFAAALSIVSTIITVGLGIIVLKFTGVLENIT
ncbi:MAG: sugar ABC transporter permease [Caldisphaera sp.]|jgi:arabinogalactan oligomer/maltooligosaccharide transport system permease protein|uniref:carbohydrate ABC transporter permease n=1 Tax=Caldisphaera sp. TaxID=2060322 RepID=UPI000CAFB191|nr:MAG: sugar ABC transporter permease [Caldisphaera sp.]